MMKRIILVMILGSFLMACKTVKPGVDANIVSVKGTLQKPGMTTYQYGTHLLKADGKTYALKSSTLNLDNFIEKQVSIKGTKVDGYPLENGPELLEVTEIK
jgi:hypothetical protein